MKTALPYSMTNLFRPTIGAIAAFVLSLSAVQLHAATGEELLMRALPASAMNKSVIPADDLVSAVSESVGGNKSQAPEIVCAAMPKTNKLAVHKAIVRAAIAAIGDSKSAIIPKIVFSSVKCSSNCGNGMTAAGCECAEEFTKVAILALGTDPDEQMVVAITNAAINALEGRCADRIVNAASSVAPQFASNIADAGANGTNGLDGGIDGEDGVVFSPTGRPVPAPFVFPPATNGGIVPDTTPVN